LEIDVSTRHQDPFGWLEEAEIVCSGRGGDVVLSPGNAVVATRPSHNARSSRHPEVRQLGAADLTMSVAALPVAEQSSHETAVAAAGVTGPCVLAVSRGCFHAAPIATAHAATGVGDRINTHVRRSRRDHAGRSIGGTSLGLWILRRSVPGDLSGPLHGGLTASARPCVNCD
jgi:hypothetical protein